MTHELYKLLKYLEEEALLYRLDRALPDGVSPYVDPRSYPRAGRDRVDSAWRRGFLVRCNPLPRFRLGSKAPHRGRLGPWNGDHNTECPVFQRNGAVGRLRMRVCHRFHMVSQRCSYHGGAPRNGSATSADQVRRSPVPRDLRAATVGLDLCS